MSFGSGAAFAAAVVVLLCHCAKSPSSEAGSLVPLPAGHPALTPLPDPELQQGQIGRGPRRLTVEQLQQSLKTTLGREWAGLPAVAASLGQADYALVNAEGIDVNMVFTKFLGDGAREVCAATANADLARPRASDRVLGQGLPDTLGVLTALPDSALRENLTILSTRFWGAPLAEPELSQWVGLSRKLGASIEKAIAEKRPGSRQQLWTALCVAMITDPRFFTY